jgi:serine O-acetyltransferase
MRSGVKRGKAIFNMGLYADAKSIAQRDPAARSTLQVILLYSGFHALIGHRLANFFYRHHRYFISRLISQLNRFFTGVEIHPGAKIGQGLFIDHGMGVVIGETAEIGDNCTIYHNVTLGGTGKEKEKRHPTLCNNVLVGAGAKILGPFRIGSNSMIGANAVVLNEIPDNATVVGVPGRVVSQWGRPVKPVKHSIELDHTNAPDPMEQDICLLRHRINDLEKRLFDLDNMDPSYINLKKTALAARECETKENETVSCSAEKK